jgi:hypothetical protein
MARINVFEGSRRIALLLRVVWLICVAAVSYMVSPEIEIHHSLLFAIGGWIVLSILQVAIGWIVRGFVGIPRGHDHTLDSR